MLPRYLILSGICLLYFFLPQTAGAQTPEEEDLNLDSLVIVADSDDTEDSEKIQILLTLARHYFRTDMVQVCRFSRSAYELADLNGDSLQKCIASRLYGVGQVLQGNHGEAAKWTMRAINTAQNLDNQEQLIKGLFNISGIYLRQGNWAQCKKYAYQLLHKSEEAGDLYHLAVANEALGLTYLTQGQTDSADFHFREAIQRYRFLDSNAELANCLSSYSGVFRARGQYDKALQQIQEAHAMFQRIEEGGMSSNYISSKLEEAGIYLEMQRFERAGTCLKTIMEEAKQQNLLDYLTQAYLLQARLDSLQGNFASSVSWLNAYIHLNDSLSSIKSNQQAAAALAGFEAQQKESSIRLLKAEGELREIRYTNQKMVLIIVLAALFILSILTAELIRRNRQIQQSHQELENQQMIVQKKNEHLLEYGHQLEEKTRELQSLNETKDRWFGIVSHDFRHPLVVLHGALDVMEDDDLTDEERSMLIQDLKKRLTRTSSLLDNLLFWAQHQMDGWKAHFESMNIHAILTPVLEVTEGWAREKEITLTCECETELNLVTNPEAVRMIVRNLISNAIKYSHSGQEIRLFTTETPTHWEINVQDFGVGLSEEQIKAIFSGDTKSMLGTQNEKGSGLGLILSSDFAKFLGGEIRVTSSQEEGTIFSLRLPRNTREVSAVLKQQKAHHNP